VVVENFRVAEGHYWTRVQAPLMAARAQAGQFANLTVARSREWSPVLPRPMALYDWDTQRGEVDFVYRVIGEGTRLLSEVPVGQALETVGPLGQGFRLDSDTRAVLLIGRGIGICSLTALAEQAAARGVAIHAVVSARRPEFILGVDLFERLGASVTAVNDLDGSSAVNLLSPRLFDALERQPVQQAYVCGSNRLLDLAARLGVRFGLDVQVSLEARMACGLGYCHGCSTGYPGLAEEAPLVCKDGPVFQVLSSE
jgi:dihydroorotate dehydrogenase electron transfer subunit